MVGGPRRPNFNPFLTGHHSILCRRSQIIFHIKYYMWKRCEKKGSRYTINAMIRIYEEAANIIRTASKPFWTTLGLGIYGLARPDLFQIRCIFLHEVGIWLKVNPWHFIFLVEIKNWFLKVRSWQRIRSIFFQDVGICTTINPGHFFFFFFEKTCSFLDLVKN